MKKNNLWIVYMGIWICVTATTCFGLYLTHSPKCLLALIIPTFVSVERKITDDNDDSTK